MGRAPGDGRVQEPKRRRAQAGDLLPELERPRVRLLQYLTPSRSRDEDSLERAHFKVKLRRVRF